MQIPQANNPVTINTSFVPNSPKTPGVEFLVTGYDYGWNSATRNMIDLLDLDFDGELDPIMAAMERFGSATGDRWIYFGYQASGFIGKWIGLDPIHNGQGWPEVQVCVGGPFDGNALLMGQYDGTSYHAVHDLTNFQPVLPWPTVTFGTGSPSFAYTPGAIFTTSSDMMLRVSIDAGATFFDLGLIGFDDPLINITYGPSEIPMQKSSDNMTIGTYGIYEQENPDPPVGYWFGSSDGGVLTRGHDLRYGRGNPGRWRSSAARQSLPA